MEKPVRVYDATRIGELAKVGNFRSVPEAVAFIKSDYTYPHDHHFVYTIVDLNDPVGSSMVMGLNLDLDY